jgi:hypothetical protein
VDKTAARFGLSSIANTPPPRRALCAAKRYPDIKENCGLDFGFCQSFSIDSAGFGKSAGAGWPLTLRGSNPNRRASHFRTLAQTLPATLRPVIDPVGGILDPALRCDDTRT